MASQNIPGVAVLNSFGYDVPWRPVSSITRIGTALGDPFGGHAINSGAISAALAAGPSAHPDTKRRWIAAFSAGWFYLFLALCSAAVATLVAVAPPGVVETVAGLALSERSVHRSPAHWKQRPAVRLQSSPSSSPLRAW
ncbi:hypothetical protein BJI47_06595 [Rhodococcus sp. 1168]|nr:hypothetical protein BJI47_06595 [Rhodococcus sp. 1168]